jgi:hypothetical protein
MYQNFNSKVNLNIVFSETRYQRQDFYQRTETVCDDIDMEPGKRGRRLCAGTDFYLLIGGLYNGSRRHSSTMDGKCKVYPDLIYKKNVKGVFLNLL